MIAIKVAIDNSVEALDDFTLDMVLQKQDVKKLRRTEALIMIGFQTLSCCARVAEGRLSTGLIATEGAGGTEVA